MERRCTAESPLQWRHNEHDGVSNHQPRNCLLNRLFRRRSKKISKFGATGLCAGNSPGTGEFPAQRASNADSVVNYNSIHRGHFSFNDSERHAIAHPWGRRYGLSSSLAEVLPFAIVVLYVVCIYDRDISGVLYSIEYSTAVIMAKLRSSLNLPSYLGIASFEVHCIFEKIPYTHYVWMDPSLIYIWLRMPNSKWPMLHLYHCRTACGSVLYWTAIYRKSAVLHSMSHSMSDRDWLGKCKMQWSAWVFQNFHSLIPKALWPMQRLWDIYGTEILVYGTYYTRYHSHAPRCGRGVVCKATDIPAWYSAV